MKRIVLNLIRQVSLFEQKRTMQTSFPRLQSVEEVKQKKKKKDLNLEYCSFLASKTTTKTKRRS